MYSVLCFITVCVVMTKSWALFLQEEGALTFENCCVCCCEIVGQRLMTNDSDRAVFLQACGDDEIRCGSLTSDPELNKVLSYSCETGKVFKSSMEITITHELDQEHSLCCLGTQSTTPTPFTVSDVSMKELCVTSRSLHTTSELLQQVPTMMPLGIPTRVPTRVPTKTPSLTESPTTLAEPPSVSDSRTLFYFISVIVCISLGIVFIIIIVVTLVRRQMQEHSEQRQQQQRILDVVEKSNWCDPMRVSSPSVFARFPGNVPETTHRSISTNEEDLKVHDPGRVRYVVRSNNGTNNSGSILEQGSSIPDVFL